MSEPQRESAGGWVGWLWRQPRNSLAKTLLVPALVSLVCAVLVAGSAMMLRPQQRANEERNRQENILAAAGLLESGGDVARRFADIEARVIDLAAGDFAPSGWLGMLNGRMFGAYVSSQLDEQLGNALGQLAAVAEPLATALT